MAKQYVKANNLKLSRYLRLAGVGCVVAGVGFLAYFLFPVVAYQFFLGVPLNSQEIESPVPKYLVGRTSSVKSLIAHGISRITFDYTDARNWYPQVHAEEKKPEAPSELPEVDSYTLAIPKLKIESASVSRTNYDLDKNLVHYYGPANPANPGTSVIFGHSTLPQWFDPHNYRAIFATLHTIEVGDEIVLTVDGKQYTYKIFATAITEADDINIFSQSYDNSYITLVTCTPPGTVWKRLIVRAVLQS